VSEEQMIEIDGESYQLDTLPDDVRQAIFLFGKAQEKLNETRTQLSIYDASCASLAGLISAKMKAHNEASIEEAEIVSE
jgi:cellobiose phosphorylase